MFDLLVMCQCYIMSVKHVLTVNLTVITYIYLYGQKYSCGKEAEVFVIICYVTYVMNSVLMLNL